MRLIVLIMLGVLGAIVIAAGVAQAAAEPDDEETAARKRLKDMAATFGTTDPTAIVGYYEFHYEHDNLPAGARTDNAVAIASLALTPSWVVRVTMPYVWDVPNQPDTSNKNGAGDLQVRVAARVYTNPYWAFLVGTDILFPTASSEQLGSGKYALGPGFAVAAPVPEVSSLVSVIVQNFNSVGGDPGRSKINYAQFQPAITTFWSDHWYTTLEPFVNVDWNRGAKTGMNVEGELGYHFESQWEVFFHPGVGLWGKELQAGYDWIVQCGARLVLPEPLFQ